MLLHTTASKKYVRKHKSLAVGVGESAFLCCFTRLQVTNMYETQTVGSWRGGEHLVVLLHTTASNKYIRKHKMLAAGVGESALLCCFIRLQVTNTYANTNCWQLAWGRALVVLLHMTARKKYVRKHK